MKHQNQIVKIKDPCHERWDAMTPTQQGRHCQACAKTVVDFTTMGDDAIIRLLVQQKGKVCGRFYADQLNRTLQPIPEVKPAPFFYRMLASVLLMAGIASADAQSIKQQAPLAMADGNDTEQKEGVIVMKVSSGTGEMINGTVKSKNGEGVQCTIHLRNTSFKIETDNQGNFSFTVPDRLLRDFMVFDIFLITDRYEARDEFTVYTSELPVTKNIVLSLEKERYILTGDTIIMYEREEAPAIPGNDQ